MKFSLTKWNGIIFSLLLIAAFFSKSIMYLSIIPPFEGWDEYQHIAYIDYLNHHHKRPILNKAIVSPELLKNVIRFPIPKLMLDQLKGSGAVDYKTFFKHDFSGTQYNNSFHKVNLYEAQQGSLYYWLMLPIVHSYSSQKDLLDEVFLLRFINLILIVISISILLWLINQLVIDKKHAAILSLLVISQPLFLLNSCRVANDTLAIFTAVIVITIGLLPKFRSNFFHVLLAGILMGLSCWAKSTTAILFPFWACCLFFSYRNKEISLKRMTVYFIASYFCSFLVLYKYFVFNLNNYGMLFVMQEAIKNNNKTMVDFVKTFLNFPVLNDLRWMWTKGSIWVGGWSMLKVPTTDLPIYLTIFSLTGWIYSFFRKSGKHIVLSGQNSFLLFFLCLCESMALAWHYVQSATAWGRATTCQWYIGVCIPFFILFVYDSASKWSERVGHTIGLILLLIYFYSDARGITSMIKFYSGGGKGKVALARLASLHPAGLGTTTLFTSSFFFVFFLFIAVVFLTAKLIKNDSSKAVGTTQQLNLLRR